MDKKLHSIIGVGSLAIGCIFIGWTIGTNNTTNDSVKVNTNKLANTSGITTIDLRKAITLANTLSGEVTEDSTALPEAPATPEPTITEESTDEPVEEDVVEEPVEDSEDYSEGYSEEDSYTEDSVENYTTENFEENTEEDLQQTDDDGIMGYSDSTGTINFDEWGMYIVQRGETVESIASRFGLSVERFKQLNNITTSVYPTMRVKVKDDGSVSTKTYKWHTVVEGDTVKKLSATYGVSIWYIKQMNGIGDSNVIIPGRMLIVGES